jgi:hypothetical protein
LTRTRASARPERQTGAYTEDHQGGTKEVAVDHVVDGSRLDQQPEDEGCGDAAGEGADRIDEGDGERSCLQWKDLAAGEVRGAGARRSEEEMYVPLIITRRPRGVEVAPEQPRPDEVSDRQGGFGV